MKRQQLNAWLAKKKTTRKEANSLRAGLLPNLDMRIIYHLSFQDGGCCKRNCLNPGERLDRPPQKSLFPTMRPYRFLALLLFQGILFAHDESSSGMAGMPASKHSPSLELNGSGTSRIPEASPMDALHTSLAGWELMTHGDLYLRYTGQNLNNPELRSDDAIDFPNWLMLMGTRRFSGGMHQVDLRTMVSLDRLTEGGNGYPLLFATGETWRGSPLVDRQHPHDLFMELAAFFTHRFSPENQIFLYLGLPGEPALGPTAFMHRPANRTNPDAVLSHHNQDATHITFGVATLGWMNRLLKVDGSLFTGREPDEDRYGFDTPRFDSYSLRLSYHPDASLAAQLGAGYLNSPEALHPDEDQVRVTSSLLYSRPFAGGRFLSTGLIYGGNSHLDGDLLNSLTLESEWDWNLGTTYGRAELVQKTGGDLGIPTLAERDFWVNGLTLGASLRLFRRLGMQAVLGAQGTVNFPEEELRPYYGDVPLSAEVFFKFSPDIMMMAAEKTKTEKAPEAEGHGGH